MYYQIILVLLVCKYVNSKVYPVKDINSKVYPVKKRFFSIVAGVWQSTCFRVFRVLGVFIPHQGKRHFINHAFTNPYSLIHNIIYNLKIYNI